MSETLRIATFNLESLGEDSGGELPLAARIDVLRPQLLRLEADLLCLQEVNAQRLESKGPRVLHALDHLLEGTPYAGFRRFAGGGSGSKTLADIHNLVILSRHPIAEARAIRHALVAPPAYRPATARPPAEEALALEWDRPLLLAKIALPDGRALHVINLHLRSSLAVPVAGQKEEAFVWRSAEGWAEGFFQAAVKRAGQALEARLQVDRILERHPDALIAVVGDFNADDWEVPLRLLSADVEDTGKGELAGRTLIPLERGLAESQRFTVIHHGRRVMLDHVLVSRALFAHYRHLEVHNEAVGDELLGYALVEHATVSYHAPLVAEFALPPQD